MTYYNYLCDRISNKRHTHYLSDILHTYLSNILIGSSQENALNLLSNIGDDPAVRAVVGVLGNTFLDAK